MSTSTTVYTPYSLMESNRPNVRAIIFRYVRHWPWFVLSLGLALGAAYLYLRYKQPIYRVQASLLLLDGNKSDEQGGALREFQAATPKKSVENEIEMLRSASLMGQVVEKLHLEHRYFHETKFGKREIYQESPIELIVEKGQPILYEEPITLTFSSNSIARINGTPIPLNQSVNTEVGRIRVATRKPVSASTEPIIVQASTKQAVAGDYVGRLKAEPTSKTSSVVVLTVDDAVPAKGEAVLNTLIAEYNLASIQSKNKVASNTLQFIQQRLNGLSGELSGVERRVESFKSSEGITDLSTQAQTFLLSAKENDAKLNEVNVQLSALNDLQKYARSQSTDQSDAPATVGLSNPVLISLIGKASDLELQRTQLAQTTSSSNPQLQGIDDQIRATKRRISENVQTMKNMLESTQRTYQAKNQALAGQIRQVPRQERALMDISRQQAIKNDLYTYLLQKREETAVAFAAAVSDSRTVDAAISSMTPVKPVKPMIYLLFGMVGLLLPLGAIAGIDSLNQRIRSRHEVEKSTITPILGELSSNPGSGKKRLVITHRSRSLITEQIRTLRANLPFIESAEGGSHVLLVTSSISGEGKTFVSLNLGASLSLVDRPTVVLEMDLRRPTYQESFHLDTNIGISEYLSGEATLSDVLQPVPGYKNFFMISSGTMSEDQNPAELLSSPRLRQLITDLREQFAYVVLDTPPLGLVSDAQLMAPFADSTLFVVRHGVTPQTSLKAIELVRREQRFKNLNLVLNGVVGNDGSYLSHSHKDRYYQAAQPRRWLRG
ncbi:GumC family protein [Fibrivirga algicola]|uniref:Polysaccharide biosynthesis tyrosine autokinase n=1 Tax=Fibrivirga algicola TaxID=2950420 RepID=A0ABX0QE90_9BACT|nr:tyrosine-protein kinase family protein [Fibrivirga algicola]NID10504.1 polysaccharide biosynthesis tyrosine autokinase [Fibrivirga algicola]